MDGDQSQLELSYTRSSSSTALLIIALAVSWLLLILWPLPLFIENPIGLAFIARKSPLYRWLFCFSSTSVILVCTFLFTVCGYFTGTAKYITLAANQPDAIGTFSPRYRCDTWWFPGDIAMGWMWLISVPNTLTIRACCALFGPVKHTYHGPLPDKQYAASVAGSKHCQQIPMSQFMTGIFTVANQNIRLQPEAVAAALHGTKRRDPKRPIELDATQAHVIYAELFQGQCLIILAPGTSTYWVERPDASSIVSLADPATGKLFAQELF